MENLKLFFFINLDIRKNRLENMYSQFKKSNILQYKMNRFEAIDGKKLDVESLPPHIFNNSGKNAIKNNKASRFGVTLTYGSAGCAISHYSLFKKCAENNDGNILILEDDIILPDDIDHYLYVVNEIDPNDYDIFYLGCHRSRYLCYGDTKYENIYRLCGSLWGGFAYILSPKCCQFIIDNVFPIGVQWDSAILPYFANNHIKALGYKYNIIKCGGFVSDNQGKNGLLDTTTYNTDIAWSQVFNIH